MTRICVGAWLCAGVAALVRALTIGWYPLGDQALIAIRADDVLTGHHPLLGTAASVALDDGVLANHPGPILFYLVALPVQLFGNGAGLAVGTTLVNIAAGVLAIVFADRQAGARGAVVTTGALALLVASYGSGLFVDSYNPTVSMLAFFAVLILCWSVLNQDAWAVPWLVAAASFCLQTNLAYSIVTVPLVMITTGWWLWAGRRQPRVGPLIAAAAVAFVVWLPPILEQLIHGGDGNVARMLRAGGSTSDPLSPADATRRTAATLTLWPAWGPGSFDSYGFFEPGPNLVLAVLSLAILAAALAAGAVLLARRGEIALARAAGLAAAMVAVAWVAAALVPLSPFVGFRADYVRWLWPIGAFAAVAGVLAVLALFGDRLPAGGHGRVAATAAAVGALAIVVLVPSDRLDGQMTDGFDREARDIARQLARQASPHLERGDVDWENDLERYPVLGLAVIAGLRQDGVDFRVSDPILVRQLGGRRASRPDRPADTTIVIEGGWQAIRDRNEAIAFASDLSDAELDELASLLAELGDAFADGAIAFTPEGAGLATGALGAVWMTDLLDTGVLPREAFYEHGPDIVTLFDGGYFDVPRPLADDVTRLVELSRGADHRIGAIVEP